LGRTKYGIGETTSTDGGRTWTPVAPSRLAHTVSRFYIRRLLSGNLLLVKHGPLDKKVGRRQLMAFLSTDDGGTWGGGLLLDQRNTVSYPDGTQHPDGGIRIIYDWNRADEKHVLMAAFREEDVLAGKPVSDDTRLRVLINHATGINPKPWLKNPKPVKYNDNQDGEALKTTPAANFESKTASSRELKKKALIFSNRTYAFDAVPDVFLGKRFIFSSIDESAATCTQAGIAYVFTPAEDRNQDSVVPELVKQGFTKAAVKEFMLFLMSGKARAANACTVYQKEVAAGEEIRFAKWGVLVF